MAESKFSVEIEWRIEDVEPLGYIINVVCICLYSYVCVYMCVICMHQ